MSSLVWEALIAIYPFFSGMAAGAYITSTLPVLFKRDELKEISLLSLLISWATLIVSPVPLLLHLGSPWRAGNIFVFPQTSSPMALFGYLWITFLILTTISIIVYNWFYSAPWFKSLATVLAGIGIIVSILFSGYIGFIFGSNKAVELWYNPIIPISFILSAILSGLALVAVLYVIIWRLCRMQVNKSTLNTMGRIVWWILLLEVAFVGVEIFVRTYMQTAEWRTLHNILIEQLGFSYLGVQLILGGIIPLILLSFKRTTSSAGLMSLMSLLILIGIFAYRWNLIIGGQLLLEASPYIYTTITYTVPLTGHGSILWISAIFLLWAFLISLALAVFSNWRMGVKIYG
ncbi:MAG: polysulfide reductase NrfD [Thaumarchaeota archaeon]|jgi:formate-dependent nitrite reductase membrane component NrfD|nr:polysulfide reductase NrfD [Candidatus Geocrenenecus arthurdayi]